MPFNISSIMPFNIMLQALCCSIQYQYASCIQHKQALCHAQVHKHYLFNMLHTVCKHYAIQYHAAYSKQALCHSNHAAYSMQALCRSISCCIQYASIMPVQYHAAYSIKLQALCRSIMLHTVSKHCMRHTVCKQYAV